MNIVYFSHEWPRMSTIPDRFYLNSVGCYSETDNSSYVLHRGHYMQKILEDDVKCIILSTYGLNTDSALSELECLLNKESRVPTLIIHGDKGKALNVASNARRRLRINKSCIKSEDQADYVEKLVAETNLQQNGSNNARRFTNAMRSSNDGELSPNRPVEVSSRRDFNEYSNHLHIERVAPKWLYPKDRSQVGTSGNSHSSSSPSDHQLVMESSPIKSEIKGSPKKISNSPKSSHRFGGHIAGVHHPKYVLVFTSKGVHVLIRLKNPHHFLHLIFFMNRLT